MGVVLILLVIYRHSFHAPFIFDDHNAIVSNAAIRHIDTALMRGPESTVTSRPIVRLTLALNYQLGGLDPFGYHVVNFALHVMNTLLLFGIVRRVLRADGVAMFVATAWAVHPLQTEAIVYVIQRTELLMGTFYLATLYAAIRASTSPKSGGWHVASVAACALGMACKEVMVSAPLLVLAYDRVFGIRARPRFYAALAATWGVLIALMVVEPRGQSAGYHFGVSSLEYLRTQAAVIWQYIGLCFWPAEQTICYDWPIATAWHQNLVRGVLLAAILALSLWGCVQRRWRWALLGVGFFFILAPTSSVVPIITEVAAERRMYLPLAAVVIAVGLIVARASPIAVAIIVTLAFVSDQRVRAYESEVSIWRDAAQKSPHSLIAHATLAKALFKVGRMDEGIAVVRAAERIDHPDALVRARMYSNLSGAYLQTRKEDEAMQAAQRALGYDADPVLAHTNIGVLLARRRQYKEAETHLRRAVETDLYSVGGNINLARVLIHTDRPAEALPHLHRVIEIRPNYVPAHDVAGVALMMMGRIEEAIVSFRRALAIDPNDAAVRDHLKDALSE